MGSGLCARVGARPACALGTGGSGPPIQDAPADTGRSGQAGLSRAAALRPGADTRGRWCRHFRIGGHCALNSVEPYVMNVAVIDLFYANEQWAKLRRPGAVEFVQKRLAALSKSLSDKPYLDGNLFTVGELMMTTV